MVVAAVSVAADAVAAGLVAVVVAVVVAGVVVVAVVVAVVVVVVVVVVVAGDRTSVVWKTGAGTSGVPAASFDGRGLTARVYPMYTEVGRAV